MTSQSLLDNMVSARAMEAGALGPWTGTFTCETRKPSPEAVSWPRKSRQPSVPGLATSPTCKRDLGQRDRRVGAQQALGLEGAQQLGPLGGQAAEEGGDVDVGEDEADLAFGPVEVERAAQDHHHPLRQLDPGLATAGAATAPTWCAST